jgi:hypothetical protein
MQGLEKTPINSSVGNNEPTNGRHRTLFLFVLQAKKAAKIIVKTFLHQP